MRDPIGTAGISFVIFGKKYRDKEWSEDERKGKRNPGKDGGCPRNGIGGEIAVTVASRSSGEKAADRKDNL